MSTLHLIRVDELDPAQPLGRHLILLFRAFEDELLEHLGDYPDVTPSDLQVLRFVRPEGSQAVEIARLAGITKQGAGKAIHSLEDRGYLVRHPDPDDSRAKRIMFTERGEALISRMITVITDIEHRYATLLGPDQLTALKDTLKMLFEDHQNRRTKS